MGTRGINVRIVATAVRRRVADPTHDALRDLPPSATRDPWRSWMAAQRLIHPSEYRIANSLNHGGVPPPLVAEHDNPSVIGVQLSPSGTFSGTACGYAFRWSGAADGRGLAVALR
jgi:hypothetical protein